jgi:hypothetical protein
MTIKRQRLVHIDKSAVIGSEERNEDASDQSFFFGTADLREILDRISEQEEALADASSEGRTSRRDGTHFPEALHPVTVPLLYAK